MVDGIYYELINTQRPGLLALPHLRKTARASNANWVAFDEVIETAPVEGNCCARYYLLNPSNRNPGNRAGTLIDRSGNVIRSIDGSIA